MVKEQEEKSVQIQEQRGLWKASSFIHRIAKRLIKKNSPIGIRYILEAHRLLFVEGKEKGMGGKYRRENPTVKRIDDSTLKIPHWKDVPNQMAVLDETLKSKMSSLFHAFTKRDYVEIIDLAVSSSHRLACIHPFHNGNGRMSRLLIDFILFRAGLPSIAIKEDKIKYLQAMFQADNGDFGPLRRLVLKGLTESQKKKLYAQKSILTVRGGKQEMLNLRKRDFK